jgi:hypothetical protein
MSDNLRSALASADDEAILDELERRIAKGVATDAERLFRGVTLLMPPFVDEEAASNAFRELYRGPRAFEAAIWDAYRFATLLPDGDTTFEPLLTARSESAVAAHLLSDVANTRRERALAVALNRRSRAIRLFPFNIANALYWNSDLTPDDARELRGILGDLVVNKAVEREPLAVTVEGRLQEFWDNLILGTRITSVVWEHYVERFGG